MRKITAETLIRDTLVNCASDCALGDFMAGQRPSTAYARGVVVGVVSVLMGLGLEFKQALAMVKRLAPQDDCCMGPFVTDSLPPCWAEDWDRV